MKFITRLMPREGRFFLLFNEHAAHVRDGGIAIVDLLAHYDDSIARSKYNDQIEKLEHKADRVTRDTVSLLHQTFVTPFDREDIHRLAEEFDDAVDDMLAVAQRFELTKTAKVPEELHQQGEIMVQLADEAAELMARLESMKDMGPHLAAIDRLESEGDAVFNRGMARLLSGEFEALDVIRWKDLIQAMEAAMNAIEDISDVVEGIVLKHS